MGSAKGFGAELGSGQRSPPEEHGRPLVAVKSPSRGTWGPRLGATNPAPPGAASSDLPPVPPRVEDAGRVGGDGGHC